MQIGNGGHPARSKATSPNNATLAFNRRMPHFCRITSGSGVLQQNGAGTLTLTGTTTHSGGTTIAAGCRSAVAQPAPSTAITNNVTLAFNRSMP